MSANDKDTKTKDDEISALLDDDIDDHDDSHLAVASSADKAAGSPQAVTKKDSPKDNNKSDDDDDDDINIHSSASPAAAVAATVVAPVTTASAPAVVSPPPTAAAQTVPATNPAATEREARLAILTEAFPTVEKEVCEFVLESHRGDVEASINALLEISDPEFHAEPTPQPAPTPASAPVQARVQSSGVPPALPRRQTNELDGQFSNLNLGRNNNQQPAHEIDPILLASTSTSEQQLRDDEDFARTLAAMDEYRARDRQNVHAQNQQQQEPEGPGFVAEMKELMDEELPKIKERFNVAADTTKKKVNEWYTQYKNNRAEAAAKQQREREQQQHNAYRNDGSSQGHGNYYDDYSDRSREPIRFGSRLDEDEPLSRNRASPPLDGPLPGRPYNVNSASTDSNATTGGHRPTTVEDA